jgi:uncharacterized protein (DUF4415 family)
MKKTNIKSYSMREILDMQARGEVWPTRRNAKPIELGADFWKNARIVEPGQKTKASVHLRIDADVFDWFKSKGRGHLTRMNAVLKAYMLAQRDRRRA